MKAWVKRNDGLRLEDVPDPAAASDELLLRVEAVSLNRGELRAVARAADGAVPGWDVAGVVAAEAPNGKGPRRGERVAALVSGGGWAEVVRVPASHAAVIPGDVGSETAATLPIAALTVIRAIDVFGSLLGKRALITGGAGGVGQYAIQLAKLAGATVTAVSSRESVRDHLRRLGADDVVAAIDEAKPGFDFILESAGGRSLAAAIERVAPGGGIVSIGNSSNEETVFNARTLFGKGAAWIYGLLIFEEMDRGRVRASDLEGVLRLVQSGRLQAQVEVTRSWTELPAVLDELERRTFTGKAVLTVR